MLRERPGLASFRWGGVAYSGTKSPPEQSRLGWGTLKSNDDAKS